MPESHNDTTMALHLIIKGGPNDRAVQDRLAALTVFMNEWFTEDRIADAPYPAGSLLWWGFGRMVGQDRESESPGDVVIEVRHPDATEPYRFPSTGYTAQTNYRRARAVVLAWLTSTLDRSEEDDLNKREIRALEAMVTWLKNDDVTWYDRTHEGGHSFGEGFAIHVRVEPKPETD